MKKVKAKRCKVKSTLDVIRCGHKRSFFFFLLFIVFAGIQQTWLAASLYTKCLRIVYSSVSYTSRVELRIVVSNATDRATTKHINTNAYIETKHTSLVSTSAYKLRRARSYSFLVKIFLPCSESKSKRERMMNGRYERNAANLIFLS